VVDDGSDQTAQEVDVGAAEFGPLVVDLDDDHVIDADDPVRCGKSRQSR
jgi:hypothetical protein